MKPGVVLPLVALISLAGCTASTPHTSTGVAATGPSAQILARANVTKAVMRSASTSTTVTAIPATWNPGQSWWAGTKPPVQMKSGQPGCVAVLLLGFSSHMMDMGGDSDIAQTVGPTEYDSITDALPFHLTGTSSSVESQSVIAYLFDSDANAQRFDSSVRSGVKSCKTFKVASSEGDQTFQITATSDGGFSSNVTPNEAAYTSVSRNVVFVYSQFVQGASPTSTLTPGQVDNNTGLVVSGKGTAVDYAAERKAFLAELAKEIANLR
jgi:hypothetical protein